MVVDVFGLGRTCKANIVVGLRFPVNRHFCSVRVFVSSVFNVVLCVSTWVFQELITGVLLFAAAAFAELCTDIRAPLFDLALCRLFHESRGYVQKSWGGLFLSCSFREVSSKCIRGSGEWGSWVGEKQGIR